MSPTTDTLVGAPCENASVRNSWPTSADRPMPNSSSATRGSAARTGSCSRGVATAATRQNTVATAEKWVTTASGSRLLSEWSPSMATAVNPAAASAAATPRLPVSKCGCSTSATPATPTSTAASTFTPGDRPYSGHDSSATQIGNVFVRVNTSATGSLSSA